MKLTVKKLLQCCILLLAAHASAQCTWTALGNPESNQASYDNAYQMDMGVTPTGKIYVAYIDRGLGFKLLVNYYNGTNWSNIYTSTGKCVRPSVTMDGSGNCWVAYLDSATGSSVRSASVLKFVGTAMTSYGAAFSNAEYPHIAVNNAGTPYLIFSDGNNGFKANIMMWSGSFWTSAGPASTGVSNCAVRNPRIHMDSGNNIFVTYYEACSSLGSPAGVGRRWDIPTSSWVTFFYNTSVGYQQFESTYKNNNVYIAYNESFSSNNKLSVYKYSTTSNTGAAVGGTAFTAGQADKTDIAVDASGNPYVSYVDVATTLSVVTVMRYSGGVWAVAGSTLSNTAINNNYRMSAVGFDGTGNAFVAFRDANYGSKLSVKKLVSNSWTKLTQTGIVSGDFGSAPTLAIDQAGTPYVAYSDWANSGKLAVMRYTAGAWQAYGTFSNVVNLTMTTDMVFDQVSGIPYVLSYEKNTSGTSFITVYKYSGGNWTTTANSFTVPLFASSYYKLCLAAYNGSLYTAHVAYGSYNKIIVNESVNGGNWNVVGTFTNSGSLNNGIDNPTVRFDNAGKLYLAFQEQDYFGSVMKYNGSGSWTSLGSPISNQGGFRYSCLAFDRNNTPFIAYGTSNLNSYYVAEVSKYTGSSWSYVTGGLGNGYANCTRLAISKGNTPYLSLLSSSANSYTDAVEVYRINTNSAQLMTTSLGGGCNYANVAVDNNGIPYYSFFNYAGLFVNKVGLPVTVSGPANVCVGAPITFSASGGGTYQWSGPNGYSSSLSSPTISASNLNHSGNYIVSVSNNSCTLTSGLSVSVVATPTITVNSGAVCAGQVFTITPAGALQYTISGGSNTVSPTSNSTFTVTGNSLGCAASNTAVASVTVNSLPVVSVSGTVALMCVGETASLSASGATSYLWNNAVPGALYVIAPTVNTTYTLTGTDANGCSNSVVIAQNVDACAGLHSVAFNDSFSIYPNPGKGQFRINSGNGCKELVIFNSLGQIVFEQKNEAMADDTVSTDLPAGLYIVRVTTKSGKLLSSHLVVE